MTTLKIGLSAPQGAGKTTLMNVLRGSSYLRDLEKEIGGIEFLPEIVRDLKARYDFKINEHGTVETEMMVMTAHLQNLIARPRFISDRCLVDNMLYSRASVESPPEEYKVFNTWLVDYMLPRYDIVFYIPAEFDPPDDGVRNLNPEYYEKMKVAFEEFYTTPRNNVYVVKGSVMDRVYYMESVIRDVVSKKKSKEAICQ